MAAMSNTTFMKPDNYIPSNLLNLPAPVPVTSHGLGQFTAYDKRVHAQITVSDPNMLPRRQSAKAAGYDLVASEQVILPPRGSAVIDTGVSMALPEGHYGRVAGRSSLAFKHNITAFEGTIDEDYRGPIKVKLFNHSDKEFKAAPLTRIAQLIIEPYTVVNFDVMSCLSETERGSGGFGSTGSI